MTATKIDYSDEPVFAIGGRSWRARGMMTDDGFVVFAGSTVNALCESFKKEVYYPVRQRLETEGVIVACRITRDCVFKSPAQAGAVIASRLVSTNSEWKTDDELAETWGECHPKVQKVYDIKRVKASVRKGKRKSDTPPEGFSFDRFGVPVYFHTNENGSTVEVRGRISAVGV